MFLKRRLSHAQGYLELGMVAEAAAELAHITGPEAESTDVLTVRLAVQHEQRNWPEVRDLAQELARRMPGDPAIWVTLAYATRRADSLEAAEKILLTAEELHPEEPTIQFNLGCYACQRGNLVSAKVRIDRAIEIDHKFATLAATDPDLQALRAAEGTDCPPGA